METRAPFLNRGLLIETNAGQKIATCQRNISQHCWAQHCWAQHVAHLWPPCCKLRVVGSNLTIFKLSQQHPTCPNRVAEGGQHVTPNNVAMRGIDMLQSFGRGLRTFAPITPAHRYCARKFTRHAMHRVCTLSNKMNNDREDGYCCA